MRQPVVAAKKVIHDWPDERAVTILRNCWAALPAGGRLLLVEDVVQMTVESSTQFPGVVVAGKKSAAHGLSVSGSPGRQ